MARGAEVSDLEDQGYNSEANAGATEPEDKCPVSPLTGGEGREHTRLGTKIQILQLQAADTAELASRGRDFKATGDYKLYFPSDPTAICLAEIFI